MRIFRSQHFTQGFEAMLRTGLTAVSRFSIQVLVLSFPPGISYQVPPLCPSGQSSWLQFQRSGFDSRRYQIFWEVSLERGPLSLVSTIEELFERKSSGSSVWEREYGRKDPSRWARDALYAQILGTNFADKRRSLGRYSSRGLRPRFFYLFEISFWWSKGLCEAEVYRSLPSAVLCIAQGDNLVALDKKSWASKREIRI
jgi:hypothetical protein